MEDNRFKRLKSDPRFKSIPERVKKVTIDKRFLPMMTDAKFSMKGQVDEYGKRNTSKRNKEMEEFYYQDKHKSSDDEEEFQWDEKSSSDDQAQEEVDEHHDVWEEVKQSYEMSELTSNTIAIQNIDWTQINAEDIFMLLTSFCSTNEKIESVTIYISNYGKKMMELEKEGPPDALILQKEGDSKTKEKKEDLKQLKLLDIYDEKETEVVNQPELRKYELNKLKYYYAIVVCSSKELAEKVYNELNDFEIELSSIKLDISFVNNKISLPEEFKERCNTAPLKYVPKYDLFNRAIQHTNVKLTWEDNEDQHKKLKKVMKKFYNDELEDDELKDIVAIEGESEEEENLICKDCTKESLCDNCKSLRAKKIEAIKANNSDKMQKLSTTNEDEEDYFGNKGKKNKKKKVHIEFKNPLESTAQKKELELLVEDPKPDFKLDLKDTRFFDKMTKDAAYSLDPTHQAFKKVNKDIVKEQVKRKKLLHSGKLIN